MQRVPGRRGRLLEGRRAALTRARSSSIERRSHRRLRAAAGWGGVTSARILILTREAVARALAQHRATPCRRQFRWPARALSNYVVTQPVPAANVGSSIAPRRPAMSKQVYLDAARPLQSPTCVFAGGCLHARAALIAGAVRLRQRNRCRVMDRGVVNMLSSVTSNMIDRTTARRRRAAGGERYQVQARPTRAGSLLGEHAVASLRL